MKNSIFMLLFIISGSVAANVTLELGENIVALAAKDAKVSMFSRSISLPNDEQKLVIKFDSSVNPESVNQGKGRITSASYIFTFNYKGKEKITLTTPVVTDEKEAKKQAENPQFSLRANNAAIPFTLTKVDPESVTIFSDFRSLLAGEKHDAGEIKQESQDALEQAKVAYLALSDKQKLSFMKWLLKN